MERRHFLKSAAAISAVPALGLVPSNDPAKLSAAMDLLNEAAETFSDREVPAPNHTWWKRYFELVGAHMVLTEEGWEPGDVKEDVLANDGEILDEVKPE